MAAAAMAMFSLWSPSTTMRTTRTAASGNVGYATVYATRDLAAATKVKKIHPGLKEMQPLKLELSYMIILELHGTFHGTVEMQA
ncbi:hypothetical protein O988_05743 [Pseudogymnoascus sp. VKM F-3808]|nr:hypothetical protein O988_05743 [Pseudogymnoascus sp. VKM F-3808]